MKMLPLTTPLVMLLLLVGARGAQAENIRAILVGAQEVPVVSTGATGEFRGFIHRDNQSIDYELSYSGLQGPVNDSGPYPRGTTGCERRHCDLVLSVRVEPRSSRNSTLYQWFGHFHGNDYRRECCGHRW
mgnify:CR=1 FL=1